MMALASEPAASGDMADGIAELLERQHDLSMRLDCLGLNLAGAADEVRAITNKVACILQRLEGRPAAGNRRI